jgi:hypothetical protein
VSCGVVLAQDLGHAGLEFEFRDGRAAEQVLVVGQGFEDVREDATLLRVGDLRDVPRCWPLSGKIARRCDFARSAAAYRSA